MQKSSKKTIRQYQGTDKMFKDACVLANVQPTYRQYRKWWNQRGSAYAKRHTASAVAVA